MRSSLILLTSTALIYLVDCKGTKIHQRIRQNAVLLDDDNASGEGNVSGHELQRVLNENTAAEGDDDEDMKQERGNSLWEVVQKAVREYRVIKNASEDPETSLKMALEEAEAEKATKMEEAKRMEEENKTEEVRKAREARQADIVWGDVLKMKSTKGVDLMEMFTRWHQEDIDIQLVAKAMAEKNYGGVQFNRVIEEYRKFRWRKTYGSDRAKAVEEKIKAIHNAYIPTIEASKAASEAKVAAIVAEQKANNAAKPAADAKDAADKDPANHELAELAETALRDSNIAARKAAVAKAKAAAAAADLAEREAISDANTAAEAKAAAEDAAQAIADEDGMQVVTRLTEKAAAEGAQKDLLAATQFYAKIKARGDKSALEQHKAINAAIAAQPARTDEVAAKDVVENVDSEN